MVLLHTTRTDYSEKEAAKRSITVGRLIQALENYDEDTMIVFCNDNGYTYGSITAGLISETEDSVD